jgi:hypothetical protein
MTPTAAPTSTVASITSDRLLSSRVGPLIAQYKTNTEDGQFASFLADFERALNVGHCFYDCCRNVLTIFPFSHLILLQSIRWCSGILVGSLVGRKAGTLLRGGVSESLTLITDAPLVGVDVRSLMV